MRKLFVMCRDRRRSSLARWRAAGGIEIDEQSARATGTAGAQTAVANDPVGHLLQPGRARRSARLQRARRRQPRSTRHARAPVDPTPARRRRTTASHTGARCPPCSSASASARHVALGVGVFTEWGEHFGWPTHWPGRFIGQFVDITTATFDFSVSVRLLPFLSIGGGLDVVPGAVDLYRAANFGAAEGSLHVGMNGVGVGGNVGFLVDLVPKWLRLGVMYRSRVDLDLDGHAAITAPVELAAARRRPPARRRPRSSCRTRSPSAPLRSRRPDPDALGRPAHHDVARSADADADADRSGGAARHAAADAGARRCMLHNSWALRFGGELRLLGGHLHVRLGLGYDSTPLPTVALGPLLPDAQRMEIVGRPRLARAAGSRSTSATWRSCSSRRPRPTPTSAPPTTPTATSSPDSATVRFGGVGRHIHHDEPRPELEEEPAPRH